MTAIEVKKQIINDLEALPKKNLLEVYNFIEFLKLREDTWYVNYINARTKTAIQDRNKGRKFYSLKEIQEEYKK